MCYSILLSTTSEEDLGAIKSSFFRFEPEPFGYEGVTEVAKVLSFPRRWYLSGAYGGCSCHFRHADEETEFRVPEDWCPEDPEDVQATLEVYDTFCRLIRSGKSLEAISVWMPRDLTDLREVRVPVNELPPEAFLFFEGARLVFSSER